MRCLLVVVLPVCLRVAVHAYVCSYQTCDLSDPSAPCEITGSNYMEAVSVGGLGPVKVNLGAITAQSANFDQFKKIDGVIGLVRDPHSMWTALQKVGPNHLGMRYNALPEHRMGLITLGCVPFRPGRPARVSHDLQPQPPWRIATAAVS